MGERRRAERLESNLFAVIRANGDSSKLGRAIVIDVSVSGFAVETETDMEVGKDYQFDVEIPITFKAKVVRSLTPGQMKKYGLKIVGQGFFSKLLLKKLLKGSRQTVKF